MNKAIEKAKFIKVPEPMKMYYFQTPIYLNDFR